MKRELKLKTPLRNQNFTTQDCRAYPDEKGIETMWMVEHEPEDYEHYCRAYPDEKGIETMYNFITMVTFFIYCRAYPDEKGIETLV